MLCTSTTTFSRGWGLLVLCIVLLMGCDYEMPGGTAGSTTFETADLGGVVTSGAIDASNIPTDVRTRFTRADPAIYAVFEVKRVEAGTRLYVRWTNPTLKFEEQSEAVVAPQRYENTHLEFHLTPVQGSTLTALAPGQYDVQIFVNDQPGPRTSFEIVDDER